MYDKNCNLDIDECAHRNHNCEKTCINLVGSYKCACPEGLRLSLDKKSCEDINECLLRNGYGPCQDICTNTYGSYKCNCKSGRKLSENKHTCIDQLCQEIFSNCSHSCVNSHGRVYCTCPLGMELESDWINCQGN